MMSPTWGGSRVEVFCIPQYIYIYIYMYVFTNPSTQAGCDTRLIFKQSLTSWNSKFSFSYTGCHTKVKGLSRPYYLFPNELVLYQMTFMKSWVKDLNLGQQLPLHHEHLLKSIYRYIYTLALRSIWPPSKIFISHPKSVIFNEIS